MLCLKIMLERTLSLGLGAGNRTSRIPIKNVAEAQLELHDHLAGKINKEKPPPTENSRKGIYDVQASGPFSFSVLELRRMLFSQGCDWCIGK